jgi:hypothetical protein
MLAILLSVLGLVPFVVCGLAAMGPDSDRMLTALITYAAAALAFTGGIHWGLGLQSGQKSTFAQRARLGLGGLALLIGWIALLLPLVTTGWLSLILLIAAYIAAVVAEQQAATRDLLPPRHLWLRWGYTVVAVAMMVTVATLRIFGETITF